MAMGLPRLAHAIGTSLVQTPTNTAPAFLRVRSSSGLILTVICLAVFTDIFLYGMIVPVIPFALTARCGIPQSGVQRWVSILLAVYGAALLAASPVCGWLADRSASRRAPLLVGLVALAGATVMLCLGRSIGVLIVGRIFQGISAAVVWTVGLALMVDTVGQTRLGEMMGWVTLSMTSATVLGPLLGGVVYAQAGYYAVFYMAFALIAVDVVLRLLLVEKKIAKRWLPEGKDGDGSVEDLAAAIANSRAEKDLEDGTTLAPPDSEPASKILTHDGSPVAAGQDKPASLRPTVLAQTTTASSAGRSSTPRLPPILTLLTSLHLWCALVATVTQAALLTAFDTILPLRANALFGFNSTGAGLLFLALIVPSFSAPLVGWLSDRHGPRWLCAGGFILAVPAMVLLRLVDHGGTRQIVLLCGLLAVVGLALTLAMTPLMAEITNAVVLREQDMKRKTGRGFGERGAYAQAYGLFNMAFSGGLLVGPLLSGFLVESAGWAVATAVLAGLSGVTSLVAVAGVGGILWRKVHATSDSAEVEVAGDRRGR